MSEETLKKEYIIDSIHPIVLILESSVTVATKLKSEIILNRVAPASVTPSWRLTNDGVVVTRDLSF